MSEFIAFVIGYFLGAAFGVFVMALIAFSRKDDDDCI